ncbi:DUF1446 domain-containing protein [Achromobacter sp. GG226]|uniref:acyclic terpene utilization AtuA family protein n=1 Tax=Verticiella alkaliphila TaxID=2779529 RepID=UPI001C0ABD39|nr:acyclic terpene utilization AtuA family protein [Verticiella sp. GG226]MBU4611157.1 DUF1446 domain-containing protein [Verticiella sp. GG226]
MSADAFFDSSLLLRVGCGSGFSGDRTDGAGPVVRTLVAEGGACALIFETLAERTLALAQQARSADPEAGYEPLLVELLRPVLADCLAHGIRIVGNFGAANPPAAARRIAALARELGLRTPRIAIVTGDDVDTPEHRAALRENIGPAVDAVTLVSANVYLGAAEIAGALSAGADIVVAGRVADPALTLGLAVAHYGWGWDDWERLGRATMAGHLLECAAQVTGGYFCDPGMKDVPMPHDPGFPIAEIDADGECVITKAQGTGGCVDVRTVTEQLLYEVHDPGRYLTPDVVADITDAWLEAVGPDRVALRGVTGSARPPTLKVNAYHHGGWLAEAEISYAGPNAEARARLAGDIVRRRLDGALPVRIDLIGVMSVLADDEGRAAGRAQPGAATDVRLRVAGKHADAEVARRILREVTALYTCGPAGGGGVRTAIRQRLELLTCAIPRELVRAGWHFLEETTA